MNEVASRNRILLYILYFLYGCILTSILLVVFFPADKFRLYLALKVEKEFQGIACRIESAEYHFPLTIRFKNIHLSEIHRPEHAFIVINDLSITGNLRRQFKISGHLYGGEFQSRLSITQHSGSLRLADIRIHHINLEKWTELRSCLGRDLSGYLDIAGSYSGNLKGLLDGEAKGSAMLHDGSVELLQPILSLTEVNVRRSEVKFTLQQRVVTLGKSSFNGLEFDGTFRGMFHIAFPFDKSMFEITGNVSPTPSLIRTYWQWKNAADMLKRRYKQSTLPFVVNGTLGSPRFRFGG